MFPRFTRAVTLAGVIGAFGLLFSPAPAQALPGNCEGKPWGFLMSQVRVICDGPVQGDGSWVRSRVIATPAHQVPFQCFYGTYSSSCSGGYWVDTVVTDNETYPVNPGNVLGDEPSHLGPANGGAVSRGTLA